MLAIRAQGASDRELRSGSGGQAWKPFEEPRHRITPHWFALAALAPAALLAGGCSLTPEGAGAERARLADAGGPFERRFEEREVPELPPSPTWRDVLHRAFLANGELEGAYFEWKAAVERIGSASAYPNSNLSLGYSYMFSSERMKSFDRQTFSAGFDPSVSLSFPTKVAKKGEIALDEARAAGERFRGAKFELQRRVLTAWGEYSFAAERLRVQREQLGLTRLAADAARARASAGGGPRDLLTADVSVRSAEDAVRSTEAELASARAVLNGLLGREAGAGLAAPVGVQEMRPVPVGDDVVLAAAVERSPELAALAHEVQGRRDALELARLQWIPDVSPTAMFTGGISQAVGAAVMLPTNIVEVRSGIREAAAMLRGSEAVLRQAGRDRAAMVVAALAALRNSERQARLFETGIVPLTRRLLANTRQSYASGSSTYADLLDAQRALLDATLVVAQARTVREARLADLEALLGMDVEMLGASPESAAVRREETDDDQ